jgi:membrane associated rhomboid family serine protease
MFPEIDFRRTPFTLVLAAVSLALAILGEINPAKWAAAADEMVVQFLIWQNQVWRPFTTTILHVNLFPHALFNLYALILLGVPIEERIGTGRMAAFVALLAYTSSLCQYVIYGYFHPELTAVGLSGVIFGLFGFAWVGSRHRTEYYYICPPSTVQMMMAWFFLCIVLTIFDWMRIANIAHAAGLVFGLLVGLAVFQKKRRVLWTAVTCFAAALVLTTLVGVPGHLGFEYVRRTGKWWAAGWFD